MNFKKIARVVFFLYFINSILFLHCMDNPKALEVVNKDLYPISSLKKLSAQAFLKFCTEESIDKFLVSEKNLCSKVSSIIKLMPEELIDFFLEYCLTGTYSFLSSKKKCLGIALSLDHKIVAQSYSTHEKRKIARGSNVYFLANFEVLSLKNSQKIIFFKDKIKISKFVLSPDGHFLAYTNCEPNALSYPLQKIYIYDLEEQKEKYNFVITSLQNFRIQFLNNEKLLYAHNGTVILYDVIKDKKITLSLDYDYNNGILFDKNYLVYASDRGCYVFILNLKKNTYLQKLPTMNCLSSSLVSNEKKLIAAGDEQGYVYVWKLAHDYKKSVRKIFKHSHKIMSVDFDKTGNFLLTAQRNLDAPLSIWDISLQQKLLEIAPPDLALINSISWNIQGDSIIVSYDKINKNFNLPWQKHKYKKYSLPACLLGLFIKKAILK